MLEGQFGKYRIEGIAGIGGMSIVYRAFDDTLSRYVALKILNTQRAADTTALRRFRREAEIAQRLKHPHIIPIYEAGEIGEQFYLAMAYLPDGSLARRFSKPISMTLGESAAVLSEIAAALDYAHANGVVHRDLKLENVLIDDSGHYVLSDFGIAQILNVSSLTETGQTFGTPLYVSPEQVHGAKNVDFRTDLYSLGVIAYLLATGYFPFSGNSGMAILHSHLTQEPPPPSNLNPRLPPQMDWVLHKGLAKNPQDRFASAGAQAEAFAAAINHVSEVEIVILASQPTPIVSQTDPPMNRRSGKGGVGDTIPIDELTGYKPPRRTSSATAFRLAMLLVLLAFVGIVVLGLGRVLTPPPDGIGDEPVTPNVVLAETSASTTGSPTMTLTAAPSPSATASPSWTMTATPSSTRTIPPTNTRPMQTATRRTPTPSATTSAQMVLSSPSPTRRVTVATSVPATHVAPTSPAPTSVPPTQPPPTSVPPTPVPPTSVPPTSVPPTQPPPTSPLDPLIPPVVPTLVCGLLC